MVDSQVKKAALDQVQSIVNRTAFSLIPLLSGLDLSSLRP